MLVVAQCAGLLLSPRRLGRVATPRPRARASFVPSRVPRREFILGTTVAMASSPSAEARPLVLDAHLHVWPSPSAYPYAEGRAPPDALAEVSSASASGGALPSA